MNAKTKHLLKIIVCALFAAVSVIIGTVCKQYLTFGAVRVTFENLTVIMAGIFLGPFWGAAVGITSDLITCVTADQPSINPLITLGAASVGLVSGIMSKVIKNKKGFLSLFLCVLPAHIIGNMIIKSLALMYYYYGMNPVILFTRAPLYLCIAVVETIIISIITKNKYIKRELMELE